VASSLGAQGGSVVSAGSVDPYPITEEERSTVLSALVHATSAGQLTLQEFGRRTDVVLTTGSREDLQAATGGLAMPPTGRVKRHWFVPFGNRILRGRFILAPKTGAVMLMSEIHLDLRGAVLLGPEPVIRLKVLMGNLRVLVPTGIQVEVDESSLFGGRHVATYGPPPSAARPLLKIRMIGVMGSVKVNDDPKNWSPYITERG
jgi:Cell wall-active antibiotics response 4TMS YvqF/Domain of unknown function (DUF1707)